MFHLLLEIGLVCWIVLIACQHLAVASLAGWVPGALATRPDPGIAWLVLAVLMLSGIVARFGRARGGTP